jgi:hypothetical protein
LLTKSILTNFTALRLRPAENPARSSILARLLPVQRCGTVGGICCLRFPNAEETQNEPGAVPIETSRGSLVCRDRSIWHGNYPQQIDGERVVLRITFGRLALHTVENYDHLDEVWLEGKPRELSVMLGREDFLGSTTIERGSADYSLIQLRRPCRIRARDRAQAGDWSSASSPRECSCSASRTHRPA